MELLVCCLFYSLAFKILFSCQNNVVREIYYAPAPTPEEGHPCVLQLRLSIVTGHVTPPLAASISTCLFRDSFPPPQVASHCHIQNSHSQLSSNEHATDLGVVSPLSNLAIDWCWAALCITVS